VSLLMDALNKAEQAKRQAQATEAEAGATGTAPQPALKLELTPLMSDEPPPALPSTTQAPPALPELPTHLGALDEEFIAHAAATKPGVKEKKPAPSAPAEPPPATAPLAAAKSMASPVVKTTATAAQKADPQDRQAAQNLFDAKQPSTPLSNKRRALALGLLTVIAASAIGVYFWLQLQPSGGLSMVKPGTIPPRPPPQPAQPPAAPVAAVVPATPAVPPLPASEPARPATAAAPLRSEPPSPIRVSTSKLALDPLLVHGYEAYMAGNFDLARSEYLEVLKNEPSNLDALHGMAAVSLRQRQPSSAEDYYLRALEANPKDALAQAGLIGLRGQVDPLQAETRLNALLAAQPELSFIHFALGTLYASQNRWNEAQAAFFKAYKGEPDNPDTLFNLAVSLDHLQQPKLALQYYNLALAATANRPASFDKVQLNARLRELQP